MIAAVSVAVLGSLLSSLAGASFVNPAAGGAPVDFSDAFLREMVAKMGSGMADPAKDYLDVPSQGLRSLAEGISPRAMKDMPDISLPLDYDALEHSPSIRDQEYLSHSSLLGSILGNYEEKLKQRPTQNGVKSTSGSSSGSTSSTSSGSSSSSDGVLPAYCNPPNPCPLGYTASDGCLEDFENTAAFSRDYQAVQDCMCDTEHMFECTDSTQDSEITALARSIQNEGVLDSTLDTIMNDLTDENRHLVAKKFHQKKSVNPYLLGEKLPIAAKKGGVL
ncbi:uncharacterized protein LOC123504235 isoform X1 [Portunus trituberculatus]|uniref:uncharacterized protein LOC123504235 isoform X1 n=1 Tax=Portunus trituberculatus TaxID=210409 RepID=UPI001E1CCB91|nr:uncharacterized protein LOC123504235 isoform X1 [Portunus trituberculatus]